MRIVAWNVRSSTDKKWAALRALRPDVAVISEAAELPKALAAPALGEPQLTWEWEGTNPTKGVAIGAWNQPLRRRLGRESGGRWAVGAALHQTLLIGMWSCPKRGGTGNYALEATRALDAFAPQIERHHRLIVAGDFNLPSGAPAMRDLRARFATMGLVSAYHHVTGDPFGMESTDTFHARHPGERGQHIDYIWLSEELAERITNFSVEPPGPSDHSPLILDLADG